MSDTPTPQQDPLDDLLLPAPPAPGNAALRHTLLEQTTQLLRRRRRWQRTGRAAVLLLCYAAGLGTMWLVGRQLRNDESPEESPPQLVAPSQPAAARKKEGTLPQPVPPKPPPAPSRPPELAGRETAVALEWRALEAKENRAALYRQAGDRYRQEAQDIEAALRCYAKALEAAGDKDLPASPGQDDWLLMALQDARKKEREYAKKND